jgi:hypothetical protein
VTLLQQLERPRHINAGRKEDAAASSGGSRANCLGNCCRIQRLAISHSAKIDVEDMEAPGIRRCRLRGSARGSEQNQLGSGCAEADAPGYLEPSAGAKAPHHRFCFVQFRLVQIGKAITAAASLSFAVPIKL